MTTFHIKIDQIMNIFNINAVPQTTRSASPGLDTAIKYCEDSHKQTVMIISVGLNPGGGQVWGSWLCFTSGLAWSGLVIRPIICLQFGFSSRPSSQH